MSYAMRRSAVSISSKISVVLASEIRNSEAEITSMNFDLFTLNRSKLNC